MSNAASRASKLLVGALLLAAACGGSGFAPGFNAGLDGLYRSGSRLRARFTDGGDGARRFDGWYDSQLQTPCAFRLAEDGVDRCIPMADTVNGPPQYTDAACTMPVTTYLSPTQAAPFFAGDAGTSPTTIACGADIATRAATDLSGHFVAGWRIGAPQAAPPTLYSLDANGVCAPQSVAGIITTVYPVEKVAASDLVGTKTHVESRGASLAVQVLDGDDQSRTIGGLFDGATKNWCYPSWIWGVADDYRCYPTGAADVTCAPAASGGCEGDLGVNSNADFCHAPSIFRESATSCDTVDIAELPMLASDLVGTGRIRVVVSHAADDARQLLVNPNLWQDSGRYRRGPFFDTERQLACDPMTMDDGTLRCVTSDVLIADLFSDDACLNPLAEKSSSDPCAAHGPEPTPAFAVGGRWTSAAHLYGLGTEIPAGGTAYGLDTSTNLCTPLQLAYGGYATTPLDPANANPFATLTAGME